MIKRILSSPTGRIVAALGLLLTVFLVILLIQRPNLLLPLVITVVVVLAAWWLTEFLIRRGQRKRQSDFDERLAAREGIEDRRREWLEWTKELDRQNIDRYDLPFYLLVGEPQAGKSVLLHNSGLHFPFGQSRLSGVGGTKGCDWWFTDEAVVLDLAGRLFVHEGGAADEAEWKAFLELLSSYRPLCPANGVLLVVPCDSLLGDSEEQARSKAKRVQEGLTTLTQTLQAELPVYLVLTKGDRIFGFAESVHRLEVDERHQMFGWSRPAERAEAAFSLDEVSEGFDEMVARARGLRTRMMATAHLPEAIPEVDRMFAFPEELAALYPALEVYLRQVFTDTNLLDRLYLRGIYLTSGLQSGVPVARACRDMIGATGEADARALETVLTKQHAYFIKDLVRKRAFAEQGLVRPTARRAERSRRSAVIGYGVAGALAAASLLWTVQYLWQGREEAAVTVEVAALVASRGLDEESPIQSLLGALKAQHLAIVSKRAGQEERLSDDVEEEFEQLYAAIFDDYLLPRLRDEAGMSVAAREGDPKSYQDFLAQAEDGALLLQPIDFAAQQTFDRVLALAGDAGRSVAPSDERTEEPFGLQRAHELRLGIRKPSLPKLPAVGDPDAQKIQERLNDLFEKVLDPRNDWAVEADLGYLVAWKSAADRYEQLEGLDVENPAETHDICARYYAAVGKLRDSENQLRAKGSARELQPALARAELTKLEGLHSRIQRAQEGEGWELTARALRTYEFGQQKLLRARDLGAGAIGAPDSLVVPTSDVELVMNEAVERVSNPDVLPLDRTKWGVVPRQLTEARAQPTEAESDRLARQVLLAKLEALRQYWLLKMETWQAVAREVSGATTAPAAAPFRPDLVLLLVGLVAELREWETDSADTDENNWSLSAGARLKGYLKAWKLELDQADSPDVALASGGERSVLDWEIVDTLLRVERLGTTEAKSLAREARRRYVGRRHLAWEQHWETRLGEDGGPIEIVEVLGVLRAYEDELQQAPKGERESETREAGLISQTRIEWLESVDKMLAGRLQAFREEVQSNWEIPEVGKDLPLEAASALVTETLARDVLIQKLKKNPAEVVELESALSDLTHFTWPFKGTLSRTESQRPELSGANVPWGEELSLEASHAVRTVVATAGKYGPTGSASRTGDDLAKDYFAERENRLGAPDDALGLYVTGLRDAFLDRLQLEVQKKYLDEFEREVLLESADLLDALYPSKPWDISTLDNEDLVLALSKVLDHAQLLSSLRGRYLIRSGETPEDGQDFRPSDEEFAAIDDPSRTRFNRRERRLWKFDRFLTDLQAFLHQNSDRRSVRDCAFKITIEPSVSNDEEGSIWRSDRHEYIAFYPSANMHGQEGQGTLFSAAVTSPELDCEIGSKEKGGLRMRWSEKASGDELDSDATWHAATCLAPLILVWNGEKEGAEGQVSWKVRFRPWAGDEEPSELPYDAHFIVRILANGQPPELPPEHPLRD